jgi:hypothetical protein
MLILRHLSLSLDHTEAGGKARVTESRSAIIERRR